MPTTSFYVMLPSNTQLEGNRTNSFRVHLPRTLQFNSDWAVGLAVLVYPHSWPSLGTTEEQFVNIAWQNGKSTRIPLPSNSFRNPAELLHRLHLTMNEGCMALAKHVNSVKLKVLAVEANASVWARQEFIRQQRKKRKQELSQAKLPESVDEEVFWTQVFKALSVRLETLFTYGLPKGAAVTPASGEGKDENAVSKYLQPVTEYVSALGKEESEQLQELYRWKRAGEVESGWNETEKSIYKNTKKLGLDAWCNAYQNVGVVCKFDFDKAANHFSLSIDPRFVNRVELSEQLSYIIGFSDRVLHQSTVAKFVPDLRGGVSCFHVYAPGLIEPMMIGDVVAPVLRTVTIHGQPDEIVEEQFFAIQYHKLLIKEVSEITIEIRGSNGVLMPLQYGNCTLTLHFKKLSYY